MAEKLFLNEATSAARQGACFSDQEHTCLVAALVPSSGRNQRIRDQQNWRQFQFFPSDRFSDNQSKQQQQCEPTNNKSAEVHRQLHVSIDQIPRGNQPDQPDSHTILQPPHLHRSETGRQITGILDGFMNGYDKRVRPNYGGPPVEVNVTMRILSISSVSEVMMDFTADFYFRQTWRDPRLSFDKLGEIQKLYVGAEVSKRIWLPDTFFGNEKMVRQRAIERIGDRARYKLIKYLVTCLPVSCSNPYCLYLSYSTLIQLIYCAYKQSAQ